MERATKAYLLEQGYKEDEIITIHATYDMKRNTGRVKGTIAYVTFKDEPKEPIYSMEGNWSNTATLRIF